MSDKILQSIYNFLKNYDDPQNNNPLTCLSSCFGVVFYRAEGALTFSAKEYRSVSQGCPRLSVCLSVSASVAANRFWSVATC